MTGPTTSAGGIGPDGRVVVVGGGLAAVRTCSALRRKGLTGPIDVLGAESHLPYDRPPLSKDVLAGKRDETPLPFDVDKLGITYHRGRRATGLDADSRTVHTDRGDLRYDGLVIASGGTPLMLPGDGPQTTLRTVDDALQLRARLLEGHHVALIGASWIGAEVATAALARGCRVTCLELEQAPLARALGTEVAESLLPWWRDVSLRCGVTVHEVTEHGVLLADGSTVTADAVVTGIGIRPEIGWLRDAPLDLERGVLTDSRCRTNVDGIVAVGDVAQRWSDRAGRHVLTEHWDDAGGAGTTAATALLSGDVAPPLDPVPYFWSDQFGHKVQYVGHHGPHDTADIQLDAKGNLDVVTWTSPEGILSAWLGVDRPKDVIKARTGIGQQAVEHVLS